MNSRFKKEFKVDDQVFITGFPPDDPLNLAHGTILAKSTENIVDFYIVLLDNPLPTAKAIVVIETCLERLI